MYQFSHQQPQLIPQVQNHNYHSYYQQTSFEQPIISGQMIAHLPQQRSIVPLQNRVNLFNNPQYLPCKMNNYEFNYGLQDENVNIFNIKAPQKQECEGIIRKGISKKNNNPKNFIKVEANLKEKKQTEVIKSKSQKKDQQAQRAPLKKMTKIEPKFQTPIKQILSSDPLIRSIQLNFPNIQIEKDINTDNATLHQIDELVKKLPFQNNYYMRDNVKSLLHKQEKTIYTKIQEYKPIDVFDEIVKINPEFNLKGLSIKQLNEKLEQINTIFEEQQQKYLLKKEQYQQQEQIELINNLKEEDFSHPLQQSNSILVKNEQFTSQTHSTQLLEQMNIQTKKYEKSFEISQQSPQIKSSAQNNNILNKLIVKKEEHLQNQDLTSDIQCAQTNSSLRQTNMICVNEEQANKFISPFHSKISTNIQDLSLNKMKLLENNENGQFSSFKKTFCEPMGYIDDAIISNDENFDEEDIFNQMSNEDVTTFPKENSHNYDCVKRKIEYRNINPCYYNMMSQQSMSQNQNKYSSDIKHQLDNYDQFQINQKKYFNSNRIHNFIADLEDYENIHPQEINYSSLNSFNQNSTYNIQSLFREFDDINTFPQPNFLE